uniref:Uncharacterized protein n=1 Tax=Anguilla anguilla TaxID=7936 RepID=A0A0E9XSY5_ANGAN
MQVVYFTDVLVSDFNLAVKVAPCNCNCGTNTQILFHT